MIRDNEPLGDFVVIGFGPAGTSQLGYWADTPDETFYNSNF
jgi:hypothetical protein